MEIWTGTADVENGEVLVTVSAGDPLSDANCSQGSLVLLDGVAYFVAARVDTLSFNLTRAYAGVDASGISLEISPVTQATTSMVELASVIARVRSQLNIFDKNSQGLFYSQLGVTGAADPAPGFIAFDNADPDSATEAYIDVIDGNGRDVTGLLGLMEAGTTVIVRSLASTAYRAFNVASFSDEGGWVRLGTAPIDHDGVLSDTEPLSIFWLPAALGLRIDKTGLFDDRADFDDEQGGFFFLSSDGDGDTITVPCLFQKNSGSTADWGPAVPFQGPQGDKGWSPLFTAPSDGDRRVLRLTDYVGGEGTKPTSGVNQYLGPVGLVTNIASATDFRGMPGLDAYDVAVANGYAGDVSSWLLSLNGADGADGTDPGILLNWDAGTTDADPGSGYVRSDNADLSVAEFLYVSKENRAGDPIGPFLLSLASSTNSVKGHLILTRPADGSQAQLRILSVTNATDYVKLGVSVYGVPSSAYAGNDPISFQPYRSGDQGSADATSVALAINESPEVEEPDSEGLVPYTDPTTGALMHFKVGSLLASALLVEDLVVNVPAQQAGIQEAIDFVTQFRVAAGITITINLQSGYAWPGTVVVPTGEWGHITITSEDDEVLPDPVTFPTSIHGCRFNGSSHYMTRAQPIGAADSKVGTFSAWLKLEAGADGQINNWFETRNGADISFSIVKFSDNKLYFSGRSSPGGTEVLAFLSTGTVVSADGWVQIMASWDLAAGVAHLYIDDADALAATPTLANANVDWTVANWTFGRNNAAANRYINGATADFYLNTAEYIDFSVEGNRRLFRDALGMPVPLGKAAYRPTGNSPLIFLNGRVAYWERNKGTGGNFTKTGSPSYVDGPDGSTEVSQEDNSGLHFTKGTMPVWDIVLNGDDHIFEGMNINLANATFNPECGVINCMHDNFEANLSHVEGQSSVWTGSGERGIQGDSGSSFELTGATADDCVYGVSIQRSSSADGGVGGSTIPYGLRARNCFKAGVRALYTSTVNLRIGDVSADAAAKASDWSGIVIDEGSHVNATRCTTRASAPETPNVADVSVAAFNALTAAGVIYVVT